jgi:hypothetical protein
VKRRHQSGKKSLVCFVAQDCGSGLLLLAVNILMNGSNHHLSASRWWRTNFSSGNKSEASSTRKWTDCPILKIESQSSLLEMKKRKKYRR